jgi:hypothetical protein
MGPILRGAAVPADRFLAESFRSSRSLQRSYRADVSISLLSVPVFSRQGVGSAIAAVREASQDERRSLEIQFVGGSRPDRAHGIRFCGSIREIGVESDSALIQASYFGFVTAQHEESYEEARQSVLANRKVPAVFTAVEAVHIGACVSNKKVIVDLTSPMWGDWMELGRQVRSQFLNTNPPARESCQPGASTVLTFLYSILGAIRSHQERFTCAYNHNGRQYQLECEKRPDHRTGEALALRNLTACAEKVRCLSGKVRDAEARRTSSFRLWLEDGSVLPLRIEFQPRSYLRILLEFDPTIAVPNPPKEAT